TVSGVGRELVVRTTRANLAEVRNMVATLDRKPRLLLITVRQDAPEAVAGSAQVYGTRAVDSDQSVQRIRVLEGSEAGIHLGQSVPVVLRGCRAIHGRGMADATERVAYRDALSGFSVRPRLDGEAVILQLTPQHDVPGNEGR